MYPYKNKDRRVHLKIKIKTLAAEAGIIRLEATKTKGMAKWILNDHRTGIVREVARRNLLAYAMLRGKPYAKMEQKVKEPLLKFQFEQICGIAERFGMKDKEAMQSWLLDAALHLKSQGFSTQVPDVLPKTPYVPRKTSFVEKVQQAIGL